MKSIMFLYLALLFTVQCFAQSGLKQGNVYETDDPVGLDDVPVVFKVKQNFPNPFNPVTVIEYEAFTPSQYNFKVYDITGRIVYSQSDNREPGTYEIYFDAATLSSGIYFYSIQSGGYSVTKKMMLLK
jgi:hypothetical protein